MYHYYLEKLDEMQECLRKVGEGYAAFRASKPEERDVASLKELRKELYRLNTRIWTDERLDSSFRSQYMYLKGSLGAAIKACA